MRTKSYYFVLLVGICILFSFGSDLFAQSGADSMLYEIVQIDPNIGAIPPTAQAGFGSSNGGALGMTNVQRFLRTDGNNGSNSIVGHWLSAGDNVAPLLVTFFNIDSIYAQFNGDNTYSVKTIDVSGTEVLYSGTYVTTPSGVGNIQDITIMQSAPSILTSQGICEIYFVTGIEKHSQKPASFELLQNYPNPFNPSTKINFTIVKSSPVNLTVYNALGQKVLTLVDQTLPAGSHEVTFSADNLASGIYYYHLQTNDKAVTKKMLLSR